MPDVLNEVFCFNVNTAEAATLRDVARVLSIGWYWPSCQRLKKHPPSKPLEGLQKKLRRVLKGAEGHLASKHACWNKEYAKAVCGLRKAFDSMAYLDDGTDFERMLDCAVVLLKRHL